MGKNSAAAREARTQRRTEEARERRVKAGTSAIRADFDKDFSEQYYKDQETNLRDNVYMPEFNDQFETAKRQLQAALMRAGLDDSTAGEKLKAKADRQKELRMMDVNTKVQGAIDERRRNVLGGEESVLQQLTASGDMNTAAAQSASQLAINSQPLTYSPLGSIFTDFTAGLATQADQERQGTNRYNLGVTNWGNNLRRYTSNISGR